MELVIVVVDRHAVRGVEGNTELVLEERRVGDDGNKSNTNINELAAVAET